MGPQDGLIQQVSRMACLARGSIEMRNITINSSIANVVRFSGQATVMFRNGNARGADWSAPSCAGSDTGLRKLGKYPEQPYLEPEMAGEPKRLLLTRTIDHRIGSQPAALPLFQRIS